MTTEREEALELARDVGLETRTLNSIDPDEIVVDQVIITDEIERLVRLAKQRGAEEQKQNSEHLRIYLHGNCTEAECRLCKTAHYAREPHMRHAGIAFCDMG